MQGPVRSWIGLRLQKTILMILRSGADEAGNWLLTNGKSGYISAHPLRWPFADEYGKNREGAFEFYRIHYLESGLPMDEGNSIRFN